jgi:hypothetical protein
MKTNGNGRKTIFYFCFYIFFVKTGSGLENAGLETKTGYADARKRTNTDGELKN